MSNRPSLKKGLASPRTSLVIVAIVLAAVHAIEAGQHHFESVRPRCMFDFL